MANEGRMGTGAYAGKKWDGRQWVAASPEEIQQMASLPGVRRVTTLQTLPGHRIVEVVGLVSVIGASSGLTAGTKGGTALAKAQGQLFEQATSMGANAVVGVTASAFGAGGGITSVFGGDAVGVLLAGTAVIVEPAEAT